MYSEELSVNFSKENLMIKLLRSVMERNNFCLRDFRMFGIWIPDFKFPVLAKPLQLNHNDRNTGYRFRCGRYALGK